MIIRTLCFKNGAHAQYLCAMGRLLKGCEIAIPRSILGLAKNVKLPKTTPWRINVAQIGAKEVHDHPPAPLNKIQTRFLVVLAFLELFQLHKPTVDLLVEDFKKWLLSLTLALWRKVLGSWVTIFMRYIKNRNGFVK